MRLSRVATAVLSSRRGAVSVIGMLLLPCFIGIAGLVVETGHGLVEKVENQRVADQAAYAGAVAYNSTASETSMRAAAGAVATLNGYPASQVSVALVSSPNNPAGVSTSNAAYINAVQVTVTTSVPLVFSRLLGSGATLNVPSMAMAELKKQQESCLLALDSAALGIPLTGGTQVNAPACTIATNASTSVPCGTSMVSIGLTYNGAAPTRCNSTESIRLPTGPSIAAIKQFAADPLATNADIVTARSRLAQVASLVSPVAPPAPSGPVIAVPTGTFRDIDFAYDEAGTKLQAIALGCVATLSNNVWTLTCPAGTYKFNSLTVGGGRTLVFNPNGPASNVYQFRNSLNLAFATGSNIAFGPGAYTFANGLTIGYGGATFGAGTLNIIGSFLTGGATIASTDVNVSGSLTIDSTARLTGAGTLNVGGALISAGSGFAQPTVNVAGNFSVTSSAAFPNLTTLKVGGDMYVGSSGTMSFAGGDYQISKGLTVGGSTSASFGVGTYWIGRNSGICVSLTLPSLCVTASGTTTFSGSSTFLLTNGVAVGGGATLFMGSSGNANSFKIGPSTDQTAIYVGGGAYLKMGDATAAGSVFQINGHISSSNGGGSCLFLSAAENHDINGRIVTAGATILGAGVYTVNGAVGIGASGGGNKTCDGVSTGFVGAGVSLVLSNANPIINSINCLGQAFCVAAGYSNVSLTAPTAGDHAKMAVIGPATGTAGAYFTEGGSGTTISGLLYFPLGSVRLDGAASVGNGTGQCLQIIAKDISLNGGSLLASTCISGTASGSQVVLIR
ncbi:TadG family pilus assembly protein [Glacieibacterium sp.]|uniref:TadG family pilus assembly protein n=1 Tax=Glacieibacterium sp. TaxID=2860237 RepID=UPI003B00F808